MKIDGARVRIVGDNVSTDAIIPGRYLNSVNPAELAQHCFAALDGDLNETLAPQDVVVAGRNFGCGSSREKAVIALQGRGVSCVIAESFSRIFYRNAINCGLPVIECPAANTLLAEDSIIGVDIDSGRIMLGDTAINARPVPAFLLQILRHGGIWNAIDAGGLD